MGATSVSGVGQGSAEGHNRGSKFFNIGGSRILGPRVVAAGTKTLASGVGTVKLPLLTGAVTDYVVVGANQTAATAFKITMTFSTNVTLLTFAGGTTDVINYAIVKTGQEI